MKKVLMFITLILLMASCSTEPKSIMDLLTMSEAPKTTWKVVANPDHPHPQVKMITNLNLQLEFSNNDKNQIGAYVRKKHIDTLYVKELYTNYIILAVTGSEESVVRIELIKGVPYLYMLELDNNIPVGIMVRCE